jgi:hypothetical protein
MNKKTLLGALAVLAILSASGFFVFTRREPKIELGPYEALGTVAAEETLKLMVDKNGIVVVAQDAREFEMPALAAQLEAFQATARKRAKVTIDFEEVAMDVTTMMTTGGRIPPEQFFQILQKHPKAGAIVLFLGFPPLANRDWEALQPSAPKMVVVSGYRPDYQELLERHVIDLAIVPRFDAPPETSRKPQTLRDWFEQEYVILTADKAAVWPR